MSSLEDRTVASSLRREGQLHPYLLCRIALQPGSFLKEGRIIASRCSLQDCSAARFLVAHLVSVPGGISLIQKVILPNNAGVRGLCKREAWQNLLWKFTQHLPTQWLDSTVLPSVVRCIGMCREEKPKNKVDPRF